MKFFKLLILLFLINAVLLSSQEIEIIGKSVKGVPIKVYKFGKGDELIIIVAGIHGNEKNTVSTAYSIINLFQERKIQLSPDKMVWIIPLLNPDGFKENKRTNANNVDLNRNFYTENWRNKFIFINEIISAGEYPFSEPETACIKQFFESIEKNIRTVLISLHSKGDAIIPADKNFYNFQLLNILKKELSYKNNSVNYQVFGDLTEWASLSLNIAGVTIEFKNREEDEIDEIVKLIETLNSLNFKDKIYTKEFFNFLNNENDKNFILNMLPEEVLNKIKHTKNGEANFLNYFKMIGLENELLLLVNKNNKLDKNYLPSDLLTFTNKDFLTDKKSFQLREIVIEDFKKMIDDAKKDGLSLIIISAYRSYETQKSLYEYWVSKLGEKEASRVSALPGASQHQLGTTIDFNSLNTSFENTKEGKWLKENAYKYGFILSYPKNMEDITGYSYEPWHYRYVGKEAAYIIYHFFDNSLELFLNWYWDLHID